MNLRRNSDCIVIQPSDMIVIDYPDVQRIPVHHNAMQASPSTHPHDVGDPAHRLSPFAFAPHAAPLPPNVAHMHRKLHSLNLDSTVEPSSSGLSIKNNNVAANFQRPPCYRRVPSPAPTHDVARPVRVICLGINLNLNPPSSPL